MRLGTPLSVQKAWKRSRRRRERREADASSSTLFWFLKRTGKRFLLVTAWWLRSKGLSPQQRVPVSPLLLFDCTIKRSFFPSTSILYGCNLFLSSSETSSCALFVLFGLVVYIISGTAGRATTTVNRMLPHVARGFFKWTLMSMLNSAFRNGVSYNLVIARLGVVPLQGYNN